MQEARRANLQILFDLTSLPLSNSFKRNNYEHFVTRKINKKKSCFLKTYWAELPSIELDNSLSSKSKLWSKSNQSLWDIPWWCFKWQITFDKVEMPRRYFFFFLSTGDLRNANEVTCWRKLIPKVQLKMLNWIIWDTGRVTSDSSWLHVANSYS